MYSREVSIVICQRADLLLRLAATKVVAWQQAVPSAVGQRLPGLMGQLLTDDQLALQPLIDALRFLF